MSESLLTDPVVVDGSVGPKTTNTAITGRKISLKNALKFTAIIHLTQAVGHATVITPKQSQDVAGTGVKVLANNVFIAANEDVAASDAIVWKTPATSYTVAADVKSKIVMIEIPTQFLDMANGFDCISIDIGASAQATNFASILYVVDYRQSGLPKPTTYTD